MMLNSINYCRVFQADKLHNITDLVPCDVWCWRANDFTTHGHWLTNQHFLCHQLSGELWSDSFTWHFLICHITFTSLQLYCTTKQTPFLQGKVR